MDRLDDPTAPQACLARLDRLTPDAARKWGKMTAPQMVCHLNDAFGMADGSRPAADLSNVFSRSLIRWVALHTSMKWPKEAATVPEADQNIGGTAPGDWATDIAALRRNIEEFARLKRFAPHPFFGTLKREEWMTWGYRHVDHHLRQFGV